ncbi:MAG TPA: matrixin family metalloprotease [Nitrososphaeraceae archaeon]|nr:matrixin family metalloprotease [Nitrososphaeraceae archaeon]
MTYYTYIDGSTKQRQDEVRNAIQEWDRNLDSLDFEETSNKKNGDILIEFQEEYEGNKDKMLDPV